MIDLALLRDENFILMNEALWALDASFVIVSTLSAGSWIGDGDVLELYYTDAQKEAVWPVLFGQELRRNDSPDLPMAFPGE